MMQLRQNRETEKRHFKIVIIHIYEKIRRITMKNYNISLVPSPSGVGYAVTDDNLNIIKPVHHVSGIGSRLFNEGSSKQDRRNSRSARRSRHRQQGRIKALNSIMKDEIIKVDPTFFDRLYQSELSPLDKNKKYRNIIFDKPSVESYYHKKFPTIYHLEKYLINTDGKADIRLIYWALHSLLTHRGHFYNTTPVSQFKPGALNIKDKFIELNQLNQVKTFEFSVADTPEIEHILKDRFISKQNKINQLAELIFEQEPEKDIQKANTKIAKTIAKAILGNKFQLDEIIGLEVNKSEKKEWSLQLSDLNLDSKIDELSDSLTDQQLRILEILQEMYAATTLLDILQGSDSLLDAKIKSYNEYKQNRLLFFDLLKTLPDKKAHLLRQSYTLYLNNHHRDLASARKDLGIVAAANFSKTDLYALIKKTLKDEPETPESKKVLGLIDKGEFLNKQRTDLNTYIPYQLNALILNKILKNQGKHYPFLIKENPAEPDRKEAPYEISQLMQFTIPYYCGPLATPEEQKNLPESSRFGWLVRKEEGRITPWNFYNKINVIETANAFIKRSIGKDTYLLSEPVLPDNSLLYQKYKVLNELSSISLVDANTKKEKKLTAKIKQLLYKEGFKKHVTVSKTMALKILNDNNVPTSDILGLSTGKKFDNSLSTYNSWKKAFPEQIDNPHYRQDLEYMIEWSTVFTDRKILVEKLKEIEWLRPEQIKFVLEHRLTGWGKLSKRLLVELKDNKGKSIIDNLFNTKKNFMQIVSQQVYNTQIEAIALKTTKNQSLDNILEAAYTSPANRKAIRQTMKVVNEIVTLAGKGTHPDKIFLTFQRSKEQEGKLTMDRASSLLKIYRGIKDPLCTKELVDELSKNVRANLIKTKEYLYYQQLGRDALTGEIIDKTDLRNYAVLHIIPRSVVVDDSINNLVLTKVKNAKESIVVQYGSKNISDISMSVKDFWNRLQKLGLFSKGKLRNLTTDLTELNQYEKQGFIARQLVETNQIVKLLATILQGQFPHTKIIEVRQEQIANIRYQLDIYRLRDLNVYYRGMDAYLAAVVGTYLYTVYPKARRFFVYGKYLKQDKSNREEGQFKTSGHSFNFLWKLFYGGEDEIYVQGTNNIAFNKKDLLQKIKEVNNYKFQNVSLATGTRRSDLFKQTIYPRQERDVKKSRTLITKKNGLFTDIYGGYTGNVNSYFVLVQTKYKKDPDKFNLYGVPNRYVAMLEQSKAKGNYETKLKEIMEPIIKSNNKRMIGYKILKDRILYNQIIEDDGYKFFITSAQYRHNFRQMILSDQSKKILMDYVFDPNFYRHKKTEDVNNDKDAKLIKVYDEILYQIDHYLQIFTIGHHIDKLKKARPLFEKCTLAEKAQVLNDILIIAGSNQTELALKPLKTTKLTFSKQNCPLTKDAVFFYESPTGMITRKESIKDILKQNM